MRLSDRQKSVVMALIVLVVIMLMLALAEGAVQLRQYFKSGYSGNISELFRNENGLRVLVPGVNTRTISINSLGFRGPPISLDNAGGNLRIPQQTQRARLETPLATVTQGALNPAAIAGGDLSEDFI